MAIIGKGVRLVFITGVLLLGGCRPDGDLIDNGILDSFQFIELLVQLECEFGLRIELSDIDLDDLRTLERIADLVARSSATPDAEPRTPRSAAAR